MKEVKNTSKKQMNYAVEFWRFVSCMIFILVHVYIIYPLMYWHTSPWLITKDGVPTGGVMFKGSLDVIIIFYLITGYFLMRTFRKSKKEREENKLQTSPREGAGKYLLRRLKGLYLAFLICLLFGFVLTNIYNGFPITQWPKIAIECLWEWFGCVLTGLGIGNNTYGLMSAGRHMLMNGPLWFISCLLIVGYVIYYLLEKWEDLMIGLIFPVGFIVVYGYFHVNGISPMWYEFPLPGISQAAIQAFFTIGLGCVLYELIEKIKDKEFSLTGKILLTIVNVICTVIVIYHMIWGTTFTFATINGLCLIIVFLVLLNKDYLTAILNKPIWKYPGKLALYIYMLHYPIIGVLQKIFNINNTTVNGLHLICILTYIITILLSIMLMLIMDYFITPKLNSKKAVSK